MICILSIFSIINYIYIYKAAFRIPVCGVRCQQKYVRGLLGKCDSGMWDFGKVGCWEVGFWESGILGKRDFRKVGFERVGFLQGEFSGKWNFRKLGFGEL